MADTEIAPQTILETEDLEEEYEEDPRIARMEEMLADQKRTNAELVRAITAPARGQPLQQDRVAPALEFNFDGLPDPTYDRVGYERELAKRVSGVVGQRIDQTEARAAQRAAQLMADKDVQNRAEAVVKAAVPGVPDKMVGYAAGLVANRIKAEGRDPMAELRTNFDDVTQEITDHINDLFQSAAPKQAASGGGRTRGLVGGRARSPGRPAATPKGEDPREFFKDLTSVQSKARLY